MSTTAPVQDPNEAEETGAAAPSPDAAPAEPQGDNGTSPLSSINIEPAENDHAVITHHHRASDRVKSMGYHKPSTHTTNSHKELMKHLEKHTRRLKP